MAGKYLHKGKFGRLLVACCVVSGQARKKGDAIVFVSDIVIKIFK
jgi:hypothetical protein